LRPLDQPLTAQLNASPTSHEEDKHRTNQKHYKQYFCDAGRTSSDATESKQRSNECDHEKYNGVMKHVRSLGLIVNAESVAVTAYKQTG
jgi:hypothetical protein